MKHKYLLGLYDDEVPLVKGVEKLREAGYKIKEVFTPFPVHGLDEAMGLQETRLHTIGFIIGSLGMIFALSTMSYISGVDWKHMVGGKPFFAMPSFIPITFEFTVLTSSIAMVVTFYIRNNFSVFRDREIVDVRITDDRFVVAMCMKEHDTKEDLQRIAQIFKDTGAVALKERALKDELEENLWQSETDAHIHAPAHH